MRVITRERRFRWRIATDCFWCGITVDYGRRHAPTGASRDHLVPLFKGGSRDHGNIVVACRSCNSARGHSMAWVPFHELTAYTDRLPIGQVERLFHVYGQTWRLAIERERAGRGKASVNHAEPLRE